MPTANRDSRAIQPLPQREAELPEPKSPFEPADIPENPPFELPRIPESPATPESPGIDLPKVENLFQEGKGDVDATLQELARSLGSPEPKP